MRFLRNLLLVTVGFGMSGCSYIASFYICNATESAITVSYTSREGRSSAGLFSGIPILFAFNANGNEIGSEWASGDLSHSKSRSIEVTIPGNAALRTGSDVNPWMHSTDCFGDREQLLIIQAGDTTVLTGARMASFVVELDGMDRGLIIRQQHNCRRQCVHRRLKRHATWSSDR